MKGLLTRERLPLIATTVVCLGLYIAAGLKYDNFFSMRVLFNFFSDNAFLGVIAVGMTFVILTGGIDLSVGSMVGCTGIMAATLITKGQMHPMVAILIVLGFGVAVGLAQGVLIARYDLAPFLVTLAGLFFCRGVGLLISQASVRIEHPFFSELASFSIRLPERASLPLTSLIFFAVLIGGMFLAKQTTFGRTVYAIGGGHGSAHLMGLSVKRTLVGVYALSGFCSALGGVVYTIYTSSGNAIAGTGMELDVIAAVVIGGTLLSGGYGSVFGSFLGVMILGIIQTAITFQGTLSSWWTKIFIGALLLIFMLMQKAIERAASRKAG